MYSNVRSVVTIYRDNVSYIVTCKYKESKYKGSAMEYNKNKCMRKKEN